MASKKLQGEVPARVQVIKGRNEKGEQYTQLIVRGPKKFTTGIKNLTQTEIRFLVRVLAQEVR